MKPDDILDAIGHVDEACIKKAKEKSKSHKKIWITVGSFAACAMLVFYLPFIFIAMQGANSADPESENQPDSVITRIDIITVDDHISYSSMGHIELIVDVIDSVSETKPGIAVNADFDVEPQPGEYIIVVIDHYGEKKEYRLCASSLYDLDVNAKYELTAEEVLEFEILLGGKK